MFSFLYLFSPSWPCPNLSCYNYRVRSSERNRTWFLISISIRKAWNMIKIHTNSPCRVALHRRSEARAGATCKKPPEPQEPEPAGVDLLSSLVYLYLSPHAQALLFILHSYHALGYYSRHFFQDVFDRRLCGPAGSAAPARLDTVRRQVGLPVSGQ